MSLNYDTENLGNKFLYSRDFFPVVFGEDQIDGIARAIVRFAWSPVQWKDGRRLKANFIRANWCVLDFDNGLTSLAQAKRMFEDCVHVIGTTKSHGKSKNGNPPCDRFRVMVKFDEPIEDLRDYEATMAYYIDKYDTDKTCKEGARFYWPCTEVVQWSDSGYTWESFKAPPPPPPVDYSVYREHGFLPRYIIGFLKMGLPKGNRNNLCNQIAYIAAQCDFPEHTITQAIIDSPTNWEGFSRDEIVRAVKSGFAAGKRNMGGK